MKTLSYPWKALIAVALGTAMATLDASIINIAFPDLIRIFQTDLTTAMWINVAYVLVGSSLMLLFGKLSDFVGRKKIYTAGFAIFTAAMAACSLARSVEELILFRVFQGVGTAMAVGCSTAIITEAFPGKTMGRGLGMLGVAVAAGFIAGPMAGGFILQYLDWRAIFYTRVPLSLFALILAVVWLKKDTVRTGKIDLDMRGAAASFAGLFSFLYGMGQIRMHGLASAWVVVPVCGGLLLLGLLPAIERRARTPLIDFGLFGNRDFSCAMAAFFLFFLVMPVYTILLPFYLMGGMKLSAGDTGLFLTIVPVVTMIASPLAGALSDRFGPRWPATMGAGTFAVALLLMSRFDLQTGSWFIAAVLAILGIATGIFQPPNNSTIMGAVDPRFHGSASAMIATNRQVAMSIGMALTGVAFPARQAFHQERFGRAGLDAADALRHAIPPAFGELILATCLVTVMIAALAFVPPKKA